MHPLLLGALSHGREADRKRLSEAIGRVGFLHQANVSETDRNRHRIGVTRRKSEWDAAQAELVGYGERRRAAEIDVENGHSRCAGLEPHERMIRARKARDR